MQGIAGTKSMAWVWLQEKHGRATEKFTELLLVLSMRVILYA